MAVAMPYELYSTYLLAATRLVGANNSSREALRPCCGFRHRHRQLSARPSPGTHFRRRPDIDYFASLAFPGKTEAVLNNK